MAEEAKKSGVLKWILGGCAVLVLLCGGGFGALMWFGMSQITKVFEPVINQQLTHMANGDWEKAYGQMSPAYRQMTSLEEFQKKYSAHPYVQRKPTFHGSSFSQQSGVGITISGTLSFQDAGTAEATYQFTGGSSNGKQPDISGFDWK